MEILERLQDRIPDTGRLQRVVLFGRETGSRDLSAVLVRLPAAHEFLLHTHPGSEDCFFVLAGSGEALEPSGRLPIAAPAGVWIPAGHPHGLRAGAEGMLEVGFQSPADHTAVPFGNTGGNELRSSLVVYSYRSAPAPGTSPGKWSSAFPERGARHLDRSRIVSEAHDRGRTLRASARGGVRRSRVRRSTFAPSFRVQRDSHRSRVLLHTAGNPDSHVFDLGRGKGPLGK